MSFSITCAFHMFTVIARRVKVRDLITTTIYMQRQQTLGTLSTTANTFSLTRISKVHHYAAWEESASATV